MPPCGRSGPAARPCPLPRGAAHHLRRTHLALPGFGARVGPELQAPRPQAPREPGTVTDQATRAVGWRWHMEAKPDRDTGVSYRKGSGSRVPPLLRPPPPSQGHSLVAGGGGAVAELTGVERLQPPLHFVAEPAPRSRRSVFRPRERPAPTVFWARRWDMIY